MERWFGIDLLAQPEALLLLLFIPLYLWWYLARYAPRRLVVSLSYDPLQWVKPRLSITFIRYLPLALQLAAFSCFVLALARPQSVSEMRAEPVAGIDIMLLLDTSGSMETEDFPPNRLEVAKQTAIAFVDGRRYDQIGIVLFAQDALSYAPLTLDYELLRQFIRSIAPGILPRNGTAIGSAIAVGINHMRDSGSPSKVMILLTDGANNRGQIAPLTAAQLAEKYGIRIYCIGIGRESFLQTDAYGRSRRVQSDLDEASLQEIARRTGGAYFRSTDPQSLARIFERISRMETREPEESRYRVFTDHYPLPLKVGLVLLLLAFISMLTPLHNVLEQ